MTQSPAPRPRHLIDPANPPRRTAQGDRSLRRVQKWVLSVLAVTTILHLSGGLVLSAVFLDAEFTQARVGLNLIAGLVGVGAVGAALVIHQKSVWSPWLLLGLLPTLVGLLLTF